MSTRCNLRSEKKLSAISCQLSARKAPGSELTRDAVRRGLFGSKNKLRRVHDSSSSLILSHPPSSFIPYLLSFSFSLVLLCLVSCSEADKRKWQRYTPEQNYTAALESTNPDLRREAVVRIGESNYWQSDDAFNVLDAVARTDFVPQVRCVAIRILARYKDARAVEPLLAILAANGSNSDPAESKALAADDDVRWEAARALAEIQKQRLLSPDQENTACGLFVELQRADRSRNVRIVSTQALGEFRDKRVLMPLVRSLRNEDFMIADSAERSLIALTGESNEYDADAWARFIEQTPDPFANAGQNATSRPAGSSWWDQQDRAWRKMLKLGTD